MALGDGGLCLVPSSWRGSGKGLQDGDEKGEQKS